MRKMNAQRVSITMTNGTVLRGYINIGSSRRLSDFFRKTEATGQFVVVFDAIAGENKEPGVYFLNWSHILWVEPNELEYQQDESDSLTLECEPE